MHQSDTVSTQIPAGRKGVGLNSRDIIIIVFTL